MTQEKHIPQLNDAEDFSLTLYSSDGSVTKGRNVLRQNMVSMVISGEKEIFFDDKPICIQPDTILLLAAGNYLHTERRPHSERFTSIIFFFDTPFLASLVKEQADILKVVKQASHALIPKDDYLYAYINLMHTLLTSGTKPSKQLQAVKIKELLLYLLATQPAAITGLLAAQPQKTDAQKIQQVVQQNLMNGLSINDIAFLCNMSLPTFKRKFTALYHTSPAKWMQQRRLEAAAQLLHHQKARPADVYLEAGYVNHSSFSKAFKEYYGMAPKEYIGGSPITQNELLATV